MSESESDAFNWGPTLEEPHANQIEIDLVTDRVEHDDRPDEIVISPAVTDPGVFTTWITANADDLVDLVEVR